MKVTGIVRRFDDLGRIVIPRELRKQLFGTPEKSEGMPMEIFMDNDTIVLRKYEENKADDVCEWKYTKEIMDNAEFKVGCNQNALKRGIVPNNFSYHDFKYCPYCGKKIKVVEQMNTAEEYKGCRNCKYQPEPMQTCDWIKHQKEVYRVCPMWELKENKGNVE